MIKDYTKKLNYNTEFTWLDIVAPTDAEFEQVAADYSLNKELLLKCLEPNHLPKFQAEESYYFIVLRSFDENAEHGDTVQAYTHKIILFVGEKFFISIHRVPHPHINKLLDLISQNSKWFYQKKSTDLLFEVIKKVILSFEFPLHKNELDLDVIESDSFMNSSSVILLNDIYRIKRCAAVVRRTLWQTNRVIQSLSEELPESSDKLNLIKENSDMLQFLAEELELTAQNIVSLHISTASLRTSEVMRTLTIFSVFFMPLTFIVGIYGMNFTVMPELNWKFGYPTVLVGMLFICILIFCWFKKKGWFN